MKVLGISIRNELFLTYLADKIAKDTGTWLGLLKRALIHLNQRAVIYKSMMRYKLEYVSYVWKATSETWPGKVDTIQKRIVNIITMPDAFLRMNATQPVAQSRQVSALILTHPIYHGDAPTLLNDILSPLPVERIATINILTHLSTQLLWQFHPQTLIIVKRHSCLLQTAVCRLPTADCRLPTADCRLSTASGITSQRKYMQ